MPCQSGGAVPREYSGCGISAIGIAVMADNFLSANMFGAVTDLVSGAYGGASYRPDRRGRRIERITVSLVDRNYLVDRHSYAPVFLMVAFMPLIGTILLFVTGNALIGCALRLLQRAMVNDISLPS